MNSTNPMNSTNLMNPINPKLTFVILIIFAALTLYQSIILPIGEAADETDHYQYLRFVARTGHPPFTNQERQEAGFKGGLAPLYYWLTAWPIALIGEQTPPDIRRVDARPQRHIPTDGLGINHVMHTLDEAWPWRGQTLAWHLIRFFSIPMGLITLIATWFLAQRLYPNQSFIPLIALIFAALLPRFVISSAVINDDNLVFAFTALLLLIQVIILHSNHPASPKLMATFGALFGLTLLTKYFALILIPEIILTFYFLLRPKPQAPSPRYILRLIIPFTLALLLTAGPWFTFIIIRFNRISELGFIPGLAASLGEPQITEGLVGLFAGESVRPVAATYPLPEWFSLLYRSFWFEYGWMQIFAPEWIYGLFTVFVGFVGAGFIGPQIRGAWNVGRKSSSQPRTMHHALRPTFHVLRSISPSTWLLALHLFLFILVLTIRYILSATIDTGQGRHLYSALPIIALLVAVGLHRFGGWIYETSISILASKDKPSEVEEDVTSGVGGTSITDKEAGLSNALPPLTPPTGERAEQDIAKESSQSEKKMPLFSLWNNVRHSKFFSLLPTPYSLLPTPYSLPSISYSLLPTLFFLLPATLLLLPKFTIYNSQLIIDHLPFISPHYRLIPTSSSPILLPIENRQSIEFDSRLWLVGLETSSNAIAGQTLPVTLYWFAEQEASRDYLISLCLQNDDSQPVACWRGHIDDGDYLARAWEKGDTLAHTIYLPIPACIQLNDDRYVLNLEIWPLNPTQPVPTLGDTPRLQQTFSPPEITISNPPTNSTKTNQFWAGQHQLNTPTELKLHQSLTQIIYDDSADAILQSTDNNKWQPNLQTPLHLPCVDETNTPPFTRAAHYIVDPTLDTTIYQTNKQTNTIALSMRNRTLEPITTTLSFSRTLSPLALQLPDQPQVNLNPQIPTPQLPIPNYQLPITSLPITIRWHSQRWMSHPLVVALKLLDKDFTSGGERVTTLGDRYPNVLWTPTELVDETYPLQLKPNTPPGLYVLELSLLHQNDTLPDGLAYLPLINNDTVLGNNLYPLTIRLLDPAHNNSPPNPSSANIGDSIQLIGYDIQPESPHPQSPISLALYWKSTAKIPTDYTVFTQLLGPDGQVWAQWDNPPQSARYPTTAWTKNDTVVDRYSLTPNKGAPSGDYRLLVGMYNPTTGDRLPATINNQPQPNNAIELTTITIAP